MAFTQIPAAPDRSIKPARFVLWSAVGLFAVSQFLPPLEGEDARGWYFSDWANTIESLWTSVLTGNIDWAAAVEMMLTITLLAALIGIPLLAEWIRKARPILWILRFLALGGWGFLAFSIFQFLKFIQISSRVMGLEPEPIPFRSGLWVFLAALILTTLGLWMIPKAVRHQPSITREILTTDEHR
jgi:hypothetical protein